MTDERLEALKVSLVDLHRKLDALHESLCSEAPACERCGIPFGGYAHGPGFCIDRRVAR